MYFIANAISLSLSLSSFIISVRFNPILLRTYITRYIKLDNLVLLNLKSRLKSCGDLKRWYRSRMPTLLSLETRILLTAALNAFLISSLSLCNRTTAVCSSGLKPNTRLSLWCYFSSVFPKVSCEDTCES